MKNGNQIGASNNNRRNNEVLVKAALVRVESPDTLKTIKERKWILQKTEGLKMGN